MKNKNIMATLGVVLLSITANAKVTDRLIRTNHIENEAQIEAAELLQDLIQKGFVVVEDDGRLVLKSSVLEILKDYNQVKEIDWVSRPDSPTSTGGGGTGIK